MDPLAASRFMEILGSNNLDNILAGDLLNLKPQSDDFKFPHCFTWSVCVYYRLKRVHVAVLKVWEKFLTTGSSSCYRQCL